MMGNYCHRQDVPTIDTGSAESQPSLLRYRPYWRWSVTAQFGRLPATMAPLAFTLLAAAITGSYRMGAMMMVAFVLGELVTAVPVGRLLDRVGPARGARLLLCISAVTTMAVAAVAMSGAPPWALLTVTGVCGAVAGGISGGLRTVLAGLIPAGLLVRAISVDAILMEIAIITGPAIAVALGTWGSVAPVIGMAAAFALSALLLPAGKLTADAGSDGSAAAGPIPWLGAVTWWACLFVIGHLLSTLEVGALPLAERAGAPQSAAALLITVLSAASIAGSVLFAWRGRPATSVAVALLCGLAVGGGVLAFGSSWALLIGGLVLVGLCTGPLLSVSSLRLQHVLPESRRSEGFSIAYVVQSVGFASGSFSVGVLNLATAIALGAGSAITAAIFMLFSGRQSAT